MPRRNHHRVNGETPDPDRAIRLWLWLVAAGVFAMVVVGGATRLTESGLSITEWKPVTGVLPPLSAADWAQAFAKYQQIPQYHQMFPGMDLARFKTIYGWEWSHRLLGRLVGVLFAFPFLFFWARGKIGGGLRWRLAVIFALGALQGFVGWWMVSSGLVHRVEVAQERLAIHLLIAAGVFGTAIYAALRLSPRPRASAPPGFGIAAAAFALLVYVQLGLGALVAGLRAGLIYNSWPLMGASFLPAEAFRTPDAPWNDPATAQFDHRLVGYGVLAFALIQAFAAIRAALDAVARRAVSLAAVAMLQVALGVLTLVFSVPIPLALAHQATALVLFGLACAHWSASRAGPPEARATSPEMSAR